MNRYNVILGAGLTGLSAAYEMSKSKDTKVIIIEKDSVAGGASNSFRYKNCILDYGPHKFYTEIDSVKDLMRDLLGNDIFEVKKKSAICLNSHYFDYPIKINELIFGFNKKLAVSIVMSNIFQKIKNIYTKNKIINYEDAIVHRFGTELYNLIFRPQANKIWGNPAELSAILADIRLPIPSLSKMLIHMLSGNKDVIENRKINVKHFLYPKKGISQITNKLLSRIMSRGSELLHNTVPVTITIKNNRVESIVICNKENQKRTIEVENLISTIPIDEMANLITPQWDKSILSDASSLTYRSSIIAYFLVKKEIVSNNHWIFYPEKKYLFNRIYEQKLFSEQTIPYKDKTIIGLDFTASSEDPIWHMKNDQLSNILMQQLELCGLLKRNDIEDYFVKRLEKIYPIYKIGFLQKLNTVLAEESKIHNLFALGRLGLFNYSSMDQCMDMGMRICRHILNGESKNTFWESEKRYFQTYRIVD